MFITLLGGVAAPWPLAARAQQVGSCQPLARPGAISSLWVAAFTQPLRELGWVEGSTVTIEYR